MNDSVVLGFSANISNMVGINLCTPMARLPQNFTELFVNTSRSTYVRGSLVRVMIPDTLKCGVRSFITKRYWQKLCILTRANTHKMGPIGCLLIVSSQSKFTVIQLSREVRTDFTLPQCLANECHMHFQPYVGLRG